MATAFPAVASLTESGPRAHSQLPIPKRPWAVRVEIWKLAEVEFELDLDSDGDRFALAHARTETPLGGCSLGFLVEAETLVERTHDANVGDRTVRHHDG